MASRVRRFGAGTVRSLVTLAIVAVMAGCGGTERPPEDALAAKSRACHLLTPAVAQRLAGVPRVSLQAAPDVTAFYHECPYGAAGTNVFLVLGHGTIDPPARDARDAIRRGLRAGFRRIGGVGTLATESGDGHQVLIQWVRREDTLYMLQVTSNRLDLPATRAFARQVSRVAF